MPSIRSTAVRSVVVAGLMKSALNLKKKTAAQLRSSGPKPLKPPRGTTVEPLSVAGLSAEWVRANAVSPDNGRTILYFHGGAFVMGSCAQYRDMAARISKASGAPVLTVEYRLAPEHKYPAANEDCLAAYRWVLDSGVPFDSLVVGGDSAGGFLVLTTLLALRDAGDPLPAGAFLLSPFLDPIHFDGESYVTREKLDPLNDRRTFEIAAEHFLGNPAPGTLESPLRQALSGLPSLLVQVGDREVVLSDATRLVERARLAGVDATLEVWSGMWHVFQVFAGWVPEARQAVDSIGAFVRQRVV